MPQTRKKRRDLTVAVSLKLAREKLELTQDEAAQRWGINRRTLEKWETGERMPPGFARTQLEKLLADILGGAGAGGRRK